jgi:hypothetical protein
MSQQQGWISLDSCIYDYISEAELSQHKYFKLYHLAFRCMENLGLDFFYQIKTIKLLVNANKTVTLPADFRKYNKVGILNGIGQLVPFKYNENLTTYDDLRAGRIAEVSANNFASYYSYSSPVFFNYWDGSSYGNLYGIPLTGIYGGGFKINEADGVILLDTTFGWSELYMEYTANPSADREYRIPSEFREAMIAWLAWRDIANVKTSSHYNLGDKRDRRHEYFEARRKGIAQYRPFYLDQAYIQNVESQRLVIKA